MLLLLVSLLACDTQPAGDAPAAPAAAEAPAAPAATPAAAPAAGAGLPPGHPPIGALAGGDAAPAADAAPADATPAEVVEGTVSVADVWARKAELAGKTVTVHGKVVKYNAAIMGKNWLHLQDGSGSADGGDGDLTVTTQGTAAVGDEVTLSGTLATDKDFGAGYNYAVILEDATVQQ